MSDSVSSLRHLFRVLILVPCAHAAEVVETDMCIYGGTSGGVAAAVQAVRMGKSVVIVEPGRHLGGLTSGGLGWTDTGNTAAIGGISNEFYIDVGARYGGGRRFTFEPKVAEAVFEDWVARDRIPVYREQRLAAVRKTGARITEIEMTNGNIFRARVFVDTSYEGDLMGGAGVSYTVGRESNSTYGETLNGIRNNTPSHQFSVDVDPYVIPGDSGSGLLPHIEPGPLGTPGEGDDSVQAYNYRLCLTRDVNNQLPITMPAGYDPFEFELLARYITARVIAGQGNALNSFLKINNMPNGKTDVNNRGAFSTDFIGKVDAWPEGSYAVREQIWADYQRYIQGYLYFLGNDPRVPVALRNEMLAWGLCADEFIDTGGWPHQLYVREARRMISDYVMTQVNCQGGRTAPKSIGLGSYTMDSHNCRRIVSSSGYARNEGDVQVGVPQPYEIAYASIVPAVGECDNLLVTFALSASHIAFGSCRMEPVFMITSQSAATAAAFAIDDNVAIQDVDYTKLRLQLLADDQRLDWGSNVDPVGGVIVDNADPAGVTITGAWTNSSASTGFYETNYLHDQNAGQGTKRVRFTPDLPAAGNYQVYLNWPVHVNRASNVPVTLVYEGGTLSTNIDQRVNGTWRLLGTYPFAAGTNDYLLIETTGADGYVVADAVGWVAETNALLPSVHIVAGDPVATEGSPLDSAQFLVARVNPDDTGGGALAVDLRIAAGTADTNEVTALPTTVNLPAGVDIQEFEFFALPDTAVEPSETLTIRIVPQPGVFDLGTHSNATFTIAEQPFDAWRQATFTPVQLADELVSGPLANPDFDRPVNLMEFIGGSHALVPDEGAALRLVSNQLRFVRHAQAAGVPLQLQMSDDLETWVTAGQAPLIQRFSLMEWLSYTVPAGITHRYWRIAARPEGFQQGPAAFFYSFDTAQDGSGAFSSAMTAITDNFPGAPSWNRVATASGSSGGATSYTDYEGNTWLGSGNAGLPGRCIAWQPGSTGNVFELRFSTIGLSDITLRFDVRSAQQAGGAAPTQFNTVTYDAGAGELPLPGAVLPLAADNVFHEWRVDLSGVTELENKPQVTFRWTFDDLGAAPAESFRIDNLEVSASRN